MTKEKTNAKDILNLFITHSSSREVTNTYDEKSRLVPKQFNASSSSLVNIAILPNNRIGVKPMIGIENCDKTFDKKSNNDL